MNIQSVTELLVQNIRVYNFSRQIIFPRIMHDPHLQSKMQDVYKHEKVKITIRKTSIIHGECIYIYGS